MSQGSSLYPKDAAPLWRDPLRWSRTNRALAMALIIMAARIVAGLVASSMARPNEPIRLVRPDLLSAVETVMWTAAAVWAGICALGIALWRAKKDAPAFVTLVIAGFWVTNGLFVYGNGVTSPVGWVLLVGMTLLINLLFDQRHAYGGMALSLTIVLATAVAERYGWLPYAPLMSAKSLVVAGEPSTRMLVANIVPMLMAATPMLLTGHVALKRLRERERQLEWLSRVDPLTRLANRRAFLERFHAELARSMRTGKAVAVAILYVDHFKKINDLYGHAMGDRALEQIAQALVSAVRSTDLVARIGGEELAVLMPDTDYAGALLAAERCRAAIAGVGLIAKGTAIAITATLGVVATEAGQPVPSVDAMLAAADQGLYAGKLAGRNRVEGAKIQAAATQSL